MSSRSRAVSEVIASLVLLLIVSVVGTTLYSYTLTVTGLEQNELQGEIQTEAARAKERFRIVSVWWSGVGDQLSMTILNYGRLDIKILDVYVDGERVISYQEGRGEEIFTSRLGRVNFTSPVSLSTDVRYEIVVISERGVSHVYSWES